MPVLSLFESVLDPLTFDKYITTTQVFLETWWPCLAGLAFLFFRAIKYTILEDEDKSLAGLLGIDNERNQRNKLTELVRPCLCRHMTFIVPLFRSCSNWSTLLLFICLPTLLIHYLSHSHRTAFVAFFRSFVRWFVRSFVRCGGVSWDCFLCSATAER